MPSARAGRPELERIEAELRRTDEALGRYFAAFEAGTLAERDCVERIAELSHRLRGLEACREELAVEADEAPESLTEEELGGPASPRRRGHRDRRPAGTQGAAPGARRRDPGGQPRGDLPLLLFARGSTTDRVSAPSIT